ncbi:hypothetical protein MVEN_01771500 [Mycena venus]|uniref:Uncharacterized protein n=1 Tax=Mycena venus TaxID=2733690 RepID=A0A8H7CPC7_9AGAR|nr:hypothetical protein MVEN_01771500 [Mycena venus]
MSYVSASTGPQGLRLVYLGYTTKRCRRLEKTLRTSSRHLVQHIRTLVLFRGPDSHKNSLKIGAFEKICHISFMRLETVFVCDFGTTTLRSAEALQRLFSLPTLRQVRLNCSFSDPAAFLAIWDTCAPTIRHLQLFCNNRSGFALRPRVRPHSSTPIALASLKLDALNGVDEWLNHDRCPFDLSRLTVLSVPACASMVGWPGPSAPINISLFSNLQFLRINIIYPHRSMTIVHGTLAAITSSSPLRQIVFSFWPVSHVEVAMCKQLDFKVANLPLPHLSSVGLEMNINEYNRSVPFFPRLDARNLLCRTEHDWYERHIGRNDPLE